MRTVLALAPLVLLAACGGDGAGNSAAPAAPVAAASPPAGQQWTDVVSQTPEGGFRMGNPNAPIKLVEYGSRTCPTCGRFSQQGYEPLTRDFVSTGKVSFEFRDFPLHGAVDVAAAVLGACGGTGPFFPLMEQMYATQEETLNRLQALGPDFQSRVQNVSPVQAVAAYAEAAGYLDFVKQRGIPEQQARACLADQGRIDRVVKTMEQAGDTVTGTPTFLVNGEKLDAVSWEQVQAALRSAGA